MFARSIFRCFTVTLLVLGVRPFAGADPTLTVHNHTGKTLTIRQSLWSWLLDPLGPPRLLDGKCRCVLPGKKFTFPFQNLNKDMSAEIVVRRLPENGLINHEGLVIQVADSDPSCPCPPPEAEADEGLEEDSEGETDQPDQAVQAAGVKGSRSLWGGSGIPWGSLTLFPDGIMAPYSEDGFVRNGKPWR